MEKDGSTIAILFTDKPFVFRALKRIHQADLKEYLHANRFTLFDKVVVIDHINALQLIWSLTDWGSRATIEPTAVSLDGDTSTQRSRNKPPTGQANAPRRNRGSQAEPL